MADVLQLTFNPFQENTYLIYDETRDCVIIDPGCLSTEEERKLDETIAKHQLKPVRLLNTHCHIDHVFGNQHVATTYHLELEAHELEVPILEAVPQLADLYGIPGVTPSPPIQHFLQEGEPLTFGETTLEIRLTPGHSPGSICFYSAADQFLIGGDVLFYRSIGRTDLPGGDHQTLIGSILAKLMPLPDATIVYPGHGLSTTIGAERSDNPFF